MTGKHLEKRIIDLESQLNALTEMYKEVSLKHVKLLERELNKRPYKCPNCNGNGKNRTKYEYDSYGKDEFHRTYIIPAGSYSEKQCNSCQGLGIVWG